MQRIFPILFLVLSGSLPASIAHADKAIFAGGCFWCIESDFEKLDGVNSATSGYTGGHLKNPSYKQVSSTNTGHYEAVEVDFNPQKISYQQLLNHYWLSIDPFDIDGQFCDKGASYRSAIFPIDSYQLQLAKASKEALQEALGSKKTIATTIIFAKIFYPAEDYHQNYYKHNPLRYKYYRWNCGRDQRLQEIWGDKITPPVNPHQ